ncbi:MAG: chemotaxis protein CheB [Deltaproteobacteria bacterium]
MTNRKKKPSIKARSPLSEAGGATSTYGRLETKVHFPIVGIGASAGGLAAFEAFFSGMPAGKDPGMAFVLVQHLAPDHKSILTDLIRRYTRMQVFEVEDGILVQPNCAYIIPPNYDMAFLNGKLQLLDPSSPRGQRFPIDFFFRSLAQDQHELAICIVLSGTGSDGTLGVRAIKAEGGMVMAQSPESTEYDGMPRSAINTGLVDYILPAADMPAQLIAYAVNAYRKPPLLATATEPKRERELNKIFVILRAQTKHDFSQYKPSTIQRRVERRMAVHQIKRLDGYVKYLQQRPQEVEALFRDLLIGVTSFFRDPEAFTALETTVIPRLFADKPSGSTIRIWICGCSTGEEAYSIAILFKERIELLKHNYMIQLFATDIDNQAIDQARKGFFPASIANDITPERLKHFFALEADGKTYRIHKGIRDMLVFSEQDVIKDPPFSKVDLISCRNLMIYMGVELHKKVLPLFHYALNPGGFLFLSPAETVGGFDPLFTTLDRKQKLYQRNDVSCFPQRAALATFSAPMATTNVAIPRPVVKMAHPQNIPLQELAEHALLQQVIHAGILVNRQGDILYLHGRTGIYLEPATGGAGNYNILKMAREGLRPELTIALHRAALHNEIVRRSGLQVKTNSHFTTVNLSVTPVSANPAEIYDRSMFVIVLEEVPVPFAELSGVDPDKTYQSALADSAESLPIDADARLTVIQRELQAKEEYLQCSNEELEASNEELQSANEELQSVNEEMQSTNEELETSKEELQSVNEELSTINAELQIKMLDLSQVNNDMNNLLAGTGIGTIFVDMKLLILRFTPGATQIINLIPSDIGRPVEHLAPNFVGYDRLMVDLEAVLSTLIPKEVEVLTTDNSYYLMRILPYRTIDNRIEGAVINFVKITELKQAETALQKSVERYRTLFAEAPLGIALIDSLTGGICEVNPMFAKIAGRTMEEMLHLDWMSITHPDDIQRDLDNIAMLNAGTIKGFQLEKRYLHRDGTAVWISMTIAPFIVEDKARPRHLCMIEDIAERKCAEEALKKVNDLSRMAIVVRDAHDAIVLQDMEGRILAWNPSAERMYGWSEAEALERDIRELIPEGLRNEDIKRVQQLSRKEWLEPYRTQRIAKDGAVVEVWLTATALLNEDGEVYAIATTERASGIDD